MMTRLHSFARSLARTAANLMLPAFLACLLLTPAARAGTWNQSIYGGDVIVRHELDSSNNYASILFMSGLYWSNGWPTY